MEMKWEVVLITAVIVASAADVSATICAFVAAIATPKTVIGAQDCDGKLYGPPSVIRCAYAAGTAIVISFFLSALAYFFRIIGNENRRNVVICLTSAQLVANGVFLYLGMIYKKKMDGGCEISHPSFLYLTAILCAGHGLVFWASLIWPSLIGERGEEMSPSNNGSVQMSNIFKLKS